MGKVILLICILSFSITGCRDDEITYPIGGRIKLHNPDDQVRFESELGTIKYQKDNEGYVAFSLHDYDVVLAAERKAIYGENISWKNYETLILHNECQKRIYIELIEEINVKYSVRKGSDGVTDYLSWNQLDGNKVDKIRKKARFAFLDKGPECYSR